MCCPQERTGAQWEGGPWGCHRLASSCTQDTQSRVSITHPRTQSDACKGKEQAAQGGKIACKGSDELVAMSQIEAGCTGAHKSPLGGLGGTPGGGDGLLGEGDVGDGLLGLLGGVGTGGLGGVTGLLGGLLGGLPGNVGDPPLLFGMLLKPPPPPPPPAPPPEPPEGPSFSKASP